MVFLPRPYLDKIRAEMKGIPGAEISVDQESGGPPTDPPVNIEIASEDFDGLVKTAVNLKNYLDSIQVPGVEELKMDVDLNNPEITLTVDRERALIQGVSSAQIGQAIRTGLFGSEVSKIKEGKDEYKIQLRNNELQRKDLSNLLNMRVSFRDMASWWCCKKYSHQCPGKNRTYQYVWKCKTKKSKKINYTTLECINHTGI